MNKKRTNNSISKVNHKEEFDILGIIDKRIRLKCRNEKQKLYANLITDNEIVICVGPAGTGKTYIAIAKAIELLQNKSNKYDKLIICKPAIEAGEKLGFLPGPQPLTAKILTPTGWTTMGDIKVGDEVMTPEGKITKVTGVFPQGVKKIYRIETTNGSITEACDEHLWSTKNYNEFKHNKKWEIRNTKEISTQLINHKSGSEYNIYLPNNKPIEFKNNGDLNIPPYTLGVLLGDGSLNNSIVFTTIDDEIKERVENEIGKYGYYLTKNNINYNIVTKHKSNKVPKKVRLYNTEIKNEIIYESISEASLKTGINKTTLNSRCVSKRVINKIEYSFIKKTDESVNHFKNEIKKMGLFNTKSHTKFIPDIYKYSSIKNRISLLQGLLDSDGSIKENGEQTYYTTSKKLCEDIIEILKSLGINATYVIKNKKNKISYINGREIKSEKDNYIINIPKSNFNLFHLKRKKERVKLNSKVTHNKIKSIKYVGKKEAQCIMIEDENHLYITDDYIVTHNTIKDKMAPIMESLIDVIDKLVGKDIRIALEEHDVIKIQTLAFIRGKTIDNAILVLDEAQNMTNAQIKTVLTRIGDNSKFIISGDLDQSDLFKNFTHSGLYDAWTRHKNIPEIGFFEFDESDIVRNPIITKILNNYKIKGKKETPTPPPPLKPRLVNEGRKSKPLIDSEDVSKIKKENKNKLRLQNFLNKFQW